MAVDAGSIYSEIRIQLDKLRGDIQAVERNFDKIKTTSTKTANTTAASWKAGFKAMAVASAAAFAAVVLAIKSSIKVFATFEQSLANVQSVARGTPEEFERIKQAAAEAGETTRFTATQAADALYFLASAGFSATQSVDALNGVLMLAGATQSDLAFTSAAVAASISQFNLKAEDATRVANVFTAAIQNSQATMDKLATSMSVLGPVASGMGYTIEETAGALQVLYNSGIDASTAGSALRRALGDLANQASPAIAKLRTLGVTFDQVDPLANGLAEIIDVLAAAGLDAGDAMTVFGQRAGASMISMLRAGGDQIREYTAAITDTNAAAEAYAIQMDTLAGDQARLKSMVQSTAISFTEQFAPALRVITQLFTTIVGWINKIPGPLKITMAIILAGIPTVLAAGTAWALMSAAIAGAGISIAAILGPITVVVAAVGLLAGATVALVRAFREEVGVSQELLEARERNEELLEETRKKIEDVTAATNALTRADVENLEMAAARNAMYTATIKLAKQAEEAKLAELEAAKAAGGGWREGTWVSVWQYEKEIQATKDLITAHQESIETRQQMTAEMYAAADAAGAALDEMDALAAGLKEAASSAGRVRAETMDLNVELFALERRFRAFGDEVDFNKERLGLYRRAIEQLIENGVDPADAAITGLIATYRELREEYMQALTDAEAAVERREAEQKATDLLAKTLLTYRDRLQEVGASEEELTVIEQARVAQRLRDAGVEETAIAEVVALVVQYQQAVINLEEEEARAEAEDSKRRARKAADLEALAAAQAAEAARAETEDSKRQARKMADIEALTAARAAEEEQLQEAAATRVAIERELAAVEEAAQAQREQGRRTVTDAIIEYRDKILELGMSVEELSNLERERAIAAVRAAGGPADQTERAIVLINEYYDLIKDEEPWESFAEHAAKALGQVASLLGDYSNLFEAIGQRRITQLDRELEAELKRVGDNEEERTRLTEEFEKKRAEIKYRAELSAYRLTLGGAIAEAARAINVALASATWPLNLPAIAFAGLTGVAQIGTIMANQPEPPALASGGIVLPRPGGVLTKQAENRYGELSLNAGPEGEALLGQFADRIAAVISGGQQTFLLDVDGQRISEVVVDRMNDGLVRLKL